MSATSDGGHAVLRLKLRIEPAGDVYRLIHEDSGKILCSGSVDALIDWMEQTAKGRSTAPNLRAAIAEGI